MYVYCTERDFFPDLPKLERQRRWLEAVEMGDMQAVRAVQHEIRTEQRKWGNTPTPLTTTLSRTNTPLLGTPMGTPLGTPMGTPMVTPLLVHQEQQEEDEPPLRPAGRTPARTPRALSFYDRSAVPPSGGNRDASGGGGGGGYSSASSTASAAASAATALQQQQEQEQQERAAEVASEQKMRSMADMSLDGFVRRHTSEDNDAFDKLQDKAIEAHRKKW